jgi:hypothetical protein
MRPKTDAAEKHGRLQVARVLPALRRSHSEELARICGLVTYTLSDGTEVDYRVLTPADAAAAANATRDDVTMYVEVIRIAVLKPKNVLEHLASLPDQAEQIAQLGMQIILASLRAHVRWATPIKKRAL